MSDQDDSGRDDFRTRLSRGMTTSRSEIAAPARAQPPEPAPVPVPCDMILDHDQANPMIIVPYMRAKPDAVTELSLYMDDDERDRRIGSIEEKKNKLVEYLWDNAIEWHMAWFMAASEMQEKVRAVLDDPTDGEGDPDDAESPADRMGSDLAKSLAFGPNGYIGYNRHLFDSVNMLVLQYMSRETGLSDDAIKMMVDAKSPLLPGRRGRS